MKINLSLTKLNAFLVFKVNGEQVSAKSTGQKLLYNRVLNVSFKIMRVCISGFGLCKSGKIIKSLSTDVF